MGTRPGSLLRAARLIEQTVPLRLRAEIEGPDCLLGFSQRVHPGRIPVTPGDVTSLQVARGQLRHSLAAAAARLEGLEGWGDLGPQRQAALIAWLESFGPKGARAALTRIPRTAIAAARAEPDGLSAVEAVLAGDTSPRGHLTQETWRSESDGVIRMRASVDTHLKAAPLPASMLAGGGKVKQSADSSVEVLSVDAIPGRREAWCALRGRAGRWVLDLAHWCQVDTEPGSPEQSPWRRHSVLVADGVTVGDLLSFDMRRRPATGSAEETALLELARSARFALTSWKHPVALVGCDPTRKELLLAPREGALKAFCAWLRRRWNGSVSLDPATGVVRAVLAG